MTPQPCECGHAKRNHNMQSAFHRGYMKNPGYWRQSCRHVACPCRDYTLAPEAAGLPADQSQTRAIPSPYPPAAGASPVADDSPGHAAVGDLRRGLLPDPSPLTADCRTCPVETPRAVASQEPA